MGAVFDGHFEVETTNRSINLMKAIHGLVPRTHSKPDRVEQNSFKGEMGYLSSYGLARFLYHGNRGGRKRDVSKLLTNKLRGDSHLIIVRAQSFEQVHLAIYFYYSLLNEESFTQIPITVGARSTCGIKLSINFARAIYRVIGRGNHPAEYENPRESRNHERDQRRVGRFVSEWISL